jgi:hypothetical protein
VKLLLTSGGVTNPSIHSALVALLGKPVAECHALGIPTAQWGHPDGLGVPAYAIDEQTAITVVDGAVEVISEGRWRKLGQCPNRVAPGARRAG